MSVERLEKAVDELVRAQRLRLMARFGYTHGAAGGWHNHNLTHATDVGERGGCPRRAAGGQR
ncbi:MAG: hypothetical protein GEV07_20300 [Streptosporangiales bacterium]|nr:hypothetical protein [Streptosporangiales bacterium]